MLHHDGSVADAGRFGKDHHPAPDRARIGLPGLWFGIFGGPAAWSVQALANLAVSSHACYPRAVPLSAPVVPGLQGIVFATSLIAVIVCIAATSVAARNWRQSRHERQESTGLGQAHAPSAALAETGEGRTRFMALSGVIASATFLVACIAPLATVFVVAPCAG